MPRVFGGQVAAQALVAAGRTVPADRPPHSLHAYFLRPGDPGAPIVYTVDRIRDGRSFTTRRVVAVQHGQPIFHLSASFQVTEDGLEHQEPMPPAPDPLELPTAAEMLPRYADRFVDPGVAERLLEARAADRLRYVDAPPFGTVGEAREPRSQVWFRTQGKLADDGEIPRPLLDICLVTYVSDMTLLDSILLAHGRGGWAVGDVVGASLDHAMWFHRPLARRRMAALRPGVPHRPGRPGTGQGPDLHGGRAAGGVGDPGGRSGSAGPGGLGPGGLEARRRGLRGPAVPGAAGPRRAGPGAGGAASAQAGASSR